MPQELVVTDLFNQALAQLQQKNWDASIELYQKLLDQGRESLTPPQAAVIYHNMSTIAAEKGDHLMAYSWSKKSLSLDSGNSVYRENFEHYAQEFQIPNIPHQISNFDNFKSGIAKIPLDAVLGLSLILLLATIWILIKKLILTKKNQLAEVFSSVSFWPVYILGILCVLLISVSFFRWEQASCPRGVLIADKVQIQTAPGENKTVIFEAPAGLEVEVLGDMDNYFQIRSPGAFSGWIKKNQLELMSLSFQHEK